MPLLSVANLNKIVGEDGRRFHILKDIHLQIESGEFLAITGQSGSGKSTLMNILGCLASPTSGSYMINGIETHGLDSDQLARLRSHTFGFVFQRYNLLKSLTVIENVALPGFYAGIKRERRLERSAFLLNSFGLEYKYNNYPNQLSGGEQQRVSIARSLMNGGEVILADEPTGALDSQSGEIVMQTIKSLNELGHTIIMVTHNLDIAAYADRVITIQDGRLISESRNNSKSSSSEKTVFKKKKKISTGIREQMLESFKMSIQAIRAHKLRSTLTMLGIIIGISSVIAVVALARGSQEKVMANIRAMGTNTIEIFPGTGFGDVHAWRVKTLTVEDADVLGRQEYLSGATPKVTSSGTIVHKNISVNAVMRGIGDQFFKIKGFRLESGRLLNKRDIINNASVVVIDQRTKDGVFGIKEMPVGQIIIFNENPLEVVGVVKNHVSPIDYTDNPMVWVPYTTAMYKIVGNPDIDSIIVQVRDEISSEVAEKNITNLLTRRHSGIKDFFTFNTDSIKKTVENTSNTMTLLTAGIALISLIVGGIGVMNIMLVSVTERTAEIGLRMAIGARQINIQTQFLMEAVMICLFGGILGIILSLILGPVFRIINEEVILIYSFTNIIWAFICSTLVGLIFGFVPSYNAARLDPIEALTRE